MGYLLLLLSLSKYEAEWALEWSEIAIIISGFILAFGAIGEYLHQHERLPRWMQWPKLVFILMVAISLIGEFIGDAGVFVFSTDLQRIEGAEIETLDRKAKAALALADKAADDSVTAKTDAREAQGSAKLAKATAVDARHEAELVETNIASAKAQLQAAIRAVAPREITSKLFAKELQPYRDTTKYALRCNGSFWCGGNDEPAVFGETLKEDLAGVWEQIPVRSATFPTEVRGGLSGEGVVVTCGGEIWDLAAPPKTPCQKSAYALVEILNEIGISALPEEAAIINGSPSFPDGVMLIDVWPRPPLRDFQILKEEWQRRKKAMADKAQTAKQ